MSIRIDGANGIVFSDNTVQSTAINSTSTADIQGTNITALATISATQIAGNGSGITYVPGNVIVGTIGNASSDFEGNSVSVTGNIQGAFIKGDGGFLSNVVGSYNNSNVASFLSAYGSNTITTTGNIQGGFIKGDGGFLSNVGGNYGDSNVETLLSTNLGATDISTTGNISANVFIGNAAGLRSVTGANVTGTVPAATVAGTVTTAAQGNITSVGTLTSLNLSGAVSTTGNVTANVFIGNGATLSSLVGANVTGNVPQATIANTVTNPAQPNITSLGTLSSLAISTNLSAGNISLANNMTIGGNLSVTGNINLSGNVQQISGNSAEFFGDGNGFGALYAGVSTYTPVPHTILQATGDSNEFVQINLENVNSGVKASADYIVTADTGNNSTYYADFGITSSTWDGSSANNIGPVIKALDSYLYAQGGGNAAAPGGNLVVAAPNPGRTIKMVVGGGNDSNIVAQISNVGVSVTGNVSATGNVQGTYVLGNGFFLTSIQAGNIVGSYGDSNVVSFLQGGNSTFITVGGNLNTSSGVSATGNIKGANFIGNGAGLTYVPGSVIVGNVGNGSSDVTSNVVVSNTANITTANITTGNITTINTTTANVASIVGVTVANITTANITTANATTLNATTANVASIVGVTVANITTANITNGNIQTIIGTTANVKSLIGVTVANITNATISSLLSSNISASGNINASYFVGDGANLTNIQWANITGANANVAANLANFGSNPVSTTGTVTAGTVALGAGNIAISGTLISSVANVITIDPDAANVGVTGGVVILGNLSVTGNLSYLDVSTAATSNLVWQAANNANSAAAAHGGGLAIGPAAGAYASFLYDEPSDSLVSSVNLAAQGNISASGNIIGNVFIGNGATLSSLVGANVTGTVASATSATSATTAGTVTTNAQSNITSVGTLTSLDLSGAVSTTGNITGNVFIGNGAALSSVVGANVTGTVSAATSATTAGTVTTAAQPNITSVGTLSAVSVSGNAVLTSIIEVKSTVTYGATSTINLALGDYFTVTCVAGTSASTTFATSNVAASGNVSSFILNVTNGGTVTVTWMTGTKWAGGTAPTLTSSGTDAVAFYTYDGGTSWYGEKIGLNYS